MSRARPPRRQEYLPPPSNTHDRWTVDARVLAQSGGLATVELILANQGFENRWRFSTTIEWKAGMEACDVEAQALKLAGQSLRYLGRACVDVAVRKQAEPMARPEE
jgi:hypothetical protein